MDSRLESYTGNSYLLRLKKPLAHQNEMCLWRFITAEYARNPQFDKWHLIGAGIRGACPLWLINVEDWTSFFCSEFVIAALKVAEAVDAEVNSTLFQPGSIEAIGIFEPPEILNQFE